LQISKVVVYLLKKSNKKTQVMKATVKFYANKEVVKVQEFRTKLEAKKAIENYRKSVTIKERVKNEICAFIN
jgi:hypothetical protein